MERERWTQLCGAIRRVDASFQDSPRYTHRTAVIVKVYLYAAARDRPVSWACDRHNWDERDGPPPQLLPDQSTMSRRTRGARFDQFLREMDTRLAGPRGPGLVKRIDGKSLAVAAHSSDRDATWGRGPGQDCRGYKLHAVWAAGRAMPEQWAVTPLNVDERTVARRLVKRLEGTCGYLLADGLYEGDPLCRLCAAADHQLVANRRRPGSGIGHHPCGAARRRCIDLLEPPANINPFGPSLHRQPDEIDRSFGNLTSFGGGLAPLPAWVRRIWRVRAWVHAKLLINAARIRVRQRACA